MKKKVLFIASILALQASLVKAQESESVVSPDGKLRVEVSSIDGKACYQLLYDGRQLLQPSALGLKTSVADLTDGLRMGAVKRSEVKKSYDMTRTKAAHSDYSANALDVEWINRDSIRFHVIFQVSDNNVAFRYQILRQKKIGHRRAVVYSEATAFRFPKSTTTFLCPQIGPETGWEQTKPSYEEEYLPDALMATVSKYGKGYTFPCLFHIGNDWALVSETGVSSAYCGSHLSDYSAANGYTIAFPDKGENNSMGSEYAGITLPGETPWRTITVGASLKPVVETTIPFDVVDPLYEPTEDYKPGRYTWSWLIWQDNSINYDDQVKFIDLAAAMGYEYCLIDNYWDERIGRERMAELSRYAQSKNVHLMLWYNSNGFANDAPQGPRNCMNTAIAREKEMKWLKSIGVKGIKVDFFGGDKQATMSLYEDILSDANRYGLQVIFHGCTLPRGWERMYPNYVGSEAVLASENVYFSSYHADREAFQLTLHPFIRNATASMDWGGVIMNRYLSKDNKSRHPRKTSDVFEMATGITNQCSVNCVAMQPNNLNELPDFELEYLRGLPTSWDETQFIDGYPGKYVVMARRCGNHWYVAGLNATTEPIELTLNLSEYLPTDKSYTLYTDVARKKDEIVPSSVMKTVKLNKKGQFKVKMQPSGGIVIQ